MAYDIERNKGVVRAFAEAINRRDWDALDSLVAADFVRHSNAAPGVCSRDDLKRYLRSEFTIFPDAYESVEDLIAERDRVAVRHSFRGTQTGPMGRNPPSGKQMTADYLAIYRLADGTIAEAWVEWDNLSGLVQLGHARTDA
ncbi:MAG: ester cyclase [Ideonella sp.]|nr:ester cyclase [Ideonella sp.]MCC7457061.1 ester cyclase [Nitrospira sp.]